MTPLTVEDRLLIKISQTEKGWIVEERTVGVSSETVKMTYRVYAVSV